MSKPPSGLFHGTKGERALLGDAESVIGLRVSGLDLTPHPVKYKQLSSKSRRSIAQKIAKRTATLEEYKRYMWDKRFKKRRDAGIKNFWKQEVIRLKNGLPGTRRWTADQVRQILSKEKPTYNGVAMQSHHTFSAAEYPHLANLGRVIYPATPFEHLKGWHGGVL